MQSSALKVGIGALALVACLAVTATGFAEEMKFRADLKGSTEVPPVQQRRRHSGHHLRFCK